MSLHFLRGLAVVVLLAVAAAAVAGQSITLGSGKAVAILSVAPMQSSDGRTKLAITYKSALPAGKEAALREEVDEIWQHFVRDANRGNYDTAVITTSHAPRGFVFARKDGAWRTYETKARQAAKLDRAFVAEFIERLDWLYEHHEVDALLLYLASDWTLTQSSSAEPHRDPQTVTLGQFKEQLEAMSSAITSHRHLREIDDIVIDRDGTSARVSSWEFQDIVDDEDRTITMSHSIDVVELTDDGIMLLKHSENVMDRGARGAAPPRRPAPPPPRRGAP